VVTDQDLLAIDVQADSDFGASPLGRKRQVAVTQWLRPRLEQAGYIPRLHLTRREPSAAYSTTSGVTTDRAAATRDRATTGLQVNSILRTSSDAIYIGLTLPFKGCFVAMGDTGNTTAGVATWSYWNGTWTTLNSLVDGTRGATNSLSFSQAGRVTWSPPDDWVTREVNSDGAFLYYVKVSLNSPASNSVLVSQWLAIAESRLTLPCALHALGLLYAEGSGNSRGRWDEKATLYLERAQRELDLVMPSLRDEFDIDETGAVAETEASSVTIDDNLYTWERG
jgi:hypothetical protein